MRSKSVIEGMYSNKHQGPLSVFESVVVPEITAAIRDWIGSADVPGVLIGGLAVSFYARPRSTMNVEVLYVTDEQIPDSIPGFKRIRSHTFQHNETHVEVEVLSSNFLGVSKGLVQEVVKNAVESNGMKIASNSGLVALKLHRGGLTDQADIEQLILSGDINLNPYQQWLTDYQVDMFNRIDRGAAI